MKPIKRALALLCLITTFFTLPVTAAQPTAVRDITNYPDIDAPTHAHIWVYKFDDIGHWKECTICKTITTKSSHDMTQNNGDIDLMRLTYDTAWRQICPCGWKSVPRRVVPGRPENYTNATHFYDGYKWTPFTEIYKISQNTYNTDFVNPSTKKAKDIPQPYSFKDGIVYGGGLIFADPGYGVKGTIGVITGYDGFGDRSNQTAKNEVGRVVWFYSTYKDSDLSRSKFLETCPTNLSSDHPLKGLKEKYQNVSDEQWNRIMQNCVGMDYHCTSWGCHSEGYQSIKYEPCNVPRYCGWYSVNCFDEHGTRTTMWADKRYDYSCAITGKLIHGDEHLTYIDYQGPRWNDGTERLPIGGSKDDYHRNTYFRTTSNIISEEWYQFKRDSNNVTWRRLIVKPKAGCRVVGGDDNPLSETYGTYAADGTFTSVWLEVENNPPSSKAAGWDQDTFAWVYDSKYNDKRQLGPRYQFAMEDSTPPTPHNKTDTRYWKITGNGTAQKTSTQANLLCTFYDKAYLATNLVYARVVDSDKKTVIPQANGFEWVGMSKLRENAELWQVNLDISTEINGTKTIYVQTKDESGNVSDFFPIQVSYIDAKGPTISVGKADVANTTWSRTKTITVYGQDAFNNVKIGMSLTKSDPATMTVVSNDQYGFKRTITFTGNVSLPKDIVLFGQDFSNNLSYYNIVIDKLDNTIPKVKYENHKQFNGYTNVQLSGTDKQTVFQNAQTQQADGSGVKYYGWSKSPNVEPTNWQTSPTLKITETGTYYFWDKDGVDWVSDPTEGVYIPVKHKLFFDYDDPSIASNDMQNNSIKEKEVTNKEQIGALPNPAIKGWTFLGWTIWDAAESSRPSKIITYDRQDDYELNTRTRGANTIDIVASTIYKWSENKTAQAEWRENRYTIIWDDQYGNTYSTGKTYLYDHWYEAPTQVESGFERPGYYIAYWDTNKEGLSEHRIWSKDKDWPVGKDRVEQKFGNLTDVDDGVVTVYAIWKPIPYTIRIWDNYIGNADPHKDYAVDFETKFRLPSALWSHGPAVCLGYDRTSSTLITPEWKTWATVEKLTYERDAIVDIFTIWDNPPTISCDPEYYLNAAEAAANGLTENDASVSRTNLEAWLLTKCEAKDWEYTVRYGSAIIPPGQNHGYTLKVAAFEPAKVVEGAQKGVLQYYVTFEVTDDAGLQSTATMTLYVSNKVNILVN